MPTVYSSQYTDAYISKPVVKIPPGYVAGEVKFLYFSFALPGAVVAAADVIKLGKLPKGAMVLDACLSFPDLGTTGVMDLGWAASVEVDSAGTALELADADGLMAAVDMKAAAAIVNMADVAGAEVAGFLKEFAAQVDIQLVASEATTATTGTIKGYIQYVTI